MFICEVSADFNVKKKGEDCELGRLYLRAGRLSHLNELRSQMKKKESRRSRRNLKSSLNESMKRNWGGESVWVGAEVHGVILLLATCEAWAFCAA
jgi:hypothetical protein